MAVSEAPEACEGKAPTLPSEGQDVTARGSGYVESRVSGSSSKVKHQAGAALAAPSALPAHSSLHFTAYPTGHSLH